MYTYQPELSQLLLILEVLTAVVAVFYYNSLKSSHWKWLVVYLVYISLQELYFFKNNSLLGLEKQTYYTYFGIPLEYLFLFWLYAIQSLKKKGLFWLFSILVLATLIPVVYTNFSKVIYSLKFTLGSFFLIILVLLEFNKQIAEDNILEFKKNKMFYINLGVLLFYVGCVPFMAFYSFFLKEPSLWNTYYLYYVSSNCALYFLYLLSFICGKKN